MKSKYVVGCAFNTFKLFLPFFHIFKLCVFTAKTGLALVLLQGVLVLRPTDIVGFSWSVSVQGKARLAANGCSLCKRRNTALGADRPTLRACLWCSTAALQCLTRETAIACALRLAAKHHRHAEPDNISWTEH